MCADVCTQIQNDTTVPQQGADHADFMFRPFRVKRKPASDHAILLRHEHSTITVFDSSSTSISSNISIGHSEPSQANPSLASQDWSVPSPEGERIWKGLLQILTMTVQNSLVFRDRRAVFVKAKRPIPMGGRPFPSRAPPDRGTRPRARTPGNYLAHTA